MKFSGHELVVFQSYEKILLNGQIVPDPPHVFFVSYFQMWPLL